MDFPKAMTRLNSKPITFIKDTLALALVFSIAGLTANPANASVVGSDGGSISVDNSGQAAWSMPIDVPSGVNGLSPNLSLGVSSSGGNGPFGVGGSLSGLSSISRCGKSLIHDGYFQAPQFVEQDAYCLDGARLLLEPESGTYGEPGSQYRTAVESFIRVEAVGSHNGTGPASFIVTNRAGAKTYYGTSAVRKTFDFDQVTNAKTVWKVDRLDDLNGNQLEYTYSDLSVNEVQLTSIRYGFNSLQSTDAKLRVELEYSDRNDTAEVSNRGTSYSQTKRVSSVKTYVDTQLVRNYKIDYEYGEVTGASRIKKVTECASDDQCYRPSVMNYEPEQPTVWRSSNASLPASESLLNSDGTPRGTLVDINNDGKVDVVIATTNSNGVVTLKTFLGSLNGWVSSADFELPDSLFDYQIHSDGFAKANLIDVNGDGWSDYVKAYELDGVAIIETWRNNGAGFQRDSSLDLPVVLDALTTGNQSRSYGELTDLNADGLIDIVQAYKTAEGTEVRRTWLNTLRGGSAGWSESLAYQPVALLIDYSQGAEGRALATLQDANADGLVDWVQSYKVGEVVDNQTWLNTGRGWSLNSDYQLPSSLALFDYNVGDGIAAYSFSDVNGDGLPDLIKSFSAGGAVQQDTWLHTGMSWQQNAIYQLPAPMYQIAENGNVATLGGLIDVNSDGYPDYIHSFVQDGVAVEKVWLFNKQNQSWVLDSSDEYGFPFVNNRILEDGTSTAQAELSDLDHDGFPEFFSAETGAVFTSAPDQPGVYPGVLISTEDSFKSETVLSYGITTDSQIYTPAPYSQYPNIAYNAPTRVVTKVTASNGIGGTVVALHTYGEGKASAEGLGGLGYAFHGMQDGISDVEIKTYFHQTYPYAGKVRASSKYLDGTLLSLSSSNMKLKTIDIGGLETLYAYPNLSVANTYDLAGTLLKTTRSTTQVDNFGNTTVNEEQTFSAENLSTFGAHGISPTDPMSAMSAASKLQRTVETIVDFKPADLSSWIFGLPIKNTVNLTGINTEGVAESYTNVSTAKFDDVYGRPTQETLEPGNLKQVIKTYDYDDFGNRTSSTIETNEHDPRTTTTTFTDDGRFPKTVSNTLGHTITTEFDVKAGKPSKVIDPNEITKEILYDGFGTVLRETKAHQSNGALRGRQIVLPRWCDENEIASVNCPDNAHYFITALDDEGEAPEIAYFDRNGKELRKQTFGFNGKIIVVDTTYDDQGQVATVSQPYFRDDTNQQFVTRYFYDDLGRQVKRINSAGEEFKTKYEGLTITVTNPGNASTPGVQESTVTNNVFGQPLVSLNGSNRIGEADNSSSKTQYFYDLRGKLVKTVDAKGNIATITYDPIFGRKIAMDDPDLGKWSYDYDALGNLVSQTDAKGQVTKMVYDDLGRLAERTDDFGGTNPSITTWEYSNENSENQIIGGLKEVVSANLTRTLQYDMFGRIQQANSLIDGQSFTQRTGYKGTADKVDWVEYPSGLTVRSTYDDYGFPATVEGISEFSDETYNNFQTASRELIDRQREFEEWKYNKLSLDQLNRFEEHEREVRRLGGYLSDFYSEFDENLDRKRYQDTAQRYIELIDRVQQKITQHQNWLGIYQEKAEVIQTRLQPDIDRQNELIELHTPLYNDANAEREDVYEPSLARHNNYLAKVSSYGGQLNRIGTEINQNIGTINSLQASSQDNLDVIHFYIDVLFIPHIATIFKNHPEEFDRHITIEANLEYTLTHYMNPISEHTISHGFEHIGIHATEIANKAANIEEAQARITALEQRIVNERIEINFNHWEGLRAAEEVTLNASIARLNDLGDQILPLADELEEIEVRTQPDQDRLRDWLVPLIESHNNVLLSYNRRAQNYVAKISEQTGTYVNREELKWENFLKPFVDHANYAECINNPENSIGECRADNLVHVYDSDGNVDQAEQDEARAKVGERDFIDVPSFWRTNSFFCSQHYGYSCPTFFEAELKQLAKTIHVSQCNRLNSRESEQLTKDLTDAEDTTKVAESPSIAERISCEAASWSNGTTAHTAAAEYLSSDVSVINNTQAFIDFIANKHKRQVEALVTAATAGTYNAETDYESIVNNVVWQANTTAKDGTEEDFTYVKDEKLQERVQQCSAWAPAATEGAQPVCTAYINKPAEEESSESYVLIYKGNTQQLIENIQGENVALANSELKYHQQQIELILNTAEAGAYNTYYTDIQNRSAVVAQLYNEVDSAYANAEYIADYEAQKKVYWEAKDINAFGQVKKAKYGNNVETEYTYDQFARITGVHTTLGSSQILIKNYAYDALGNLISREDVLDDVYESFSYDGMNRLTEVNRTGEGTHYASTIGLDKVTYSYDELGNIIHKSDIMAASAKYHYGDIGSDENGVDKLLRPHAVTQIDGLGFFTYDDNGNQITGRGRTITYTSFNKPSRIESADGDTNMWYGPERQMVKQTEQKQNGDLETTLYIGGDYEQVTKEGATTNRHHITVAGNVIAIVDTDDTPSKSVIKESYLHKNHQSSVLAITDINGDVVEKRYFDAFGDIKSYIGEQGTYLASFVNGGAITDLSFTGHRWLASAGVIHMKGRVYDPMIGRFLSADPHIQAPMNSQSLNRYAYVLNNPLSLVDPSGYFFDKIFKGLKKLFNALKKIIKSVLKAIKKVVKSITKALKSVVSFVKENFKAVITVVAIVVVAVYAPQLLPELVKLGIGAIKTGAIVGGVQGLVATGSLSGAFKGAINGAVNGAKGFVSSFTDWRAAIANVIVPGGSTNLIQQAVNQGLRSGLINKIRGSSFSQGFKSGAIGVLASSAALWVGNKIIDGARWLGNQVVRFARSFRPTFEPNVLGTIVETGVAHDGVTRDLSLEFSDPAIAAPTVPDSNDVLAGRNIPGDVIDASVTVPASGPIEYYPRDYTGRDFEAEGLSGAFLTGRNTELERAAAIAAFGPIAAVGGIYAVRAGATAFTTAAGSTSEAVCIIGVCLAVGVSNVVKIPPGLRGALNARQTMQTSQRAAQRHINRRRNRVNDDGG